MLEGTKAILPWAGLLEEFASLCGQPGAMHWLGYFLEGKVAQHKQPYLVLDLGPGVDRKTVQPEQLEPHQLCSVVLMAEYRLGLFRTRAFLVSDGTALRTVVAPADQRRAVAIRALNCAMECGAHLAQLAYMPGEEEDEALQPIGFRHNMEWAERTRIFGAHLPVQATLEETLAQFGKSTRVNMRYYRRRLEASPGCEFVADARALIQPEMYSQLNRGSLNELPEEEFARRMDAARLLPGGYLVGLRSPEGQWLSLVGGWRQDDTSVVYFQVNSSGYEKASLGTVMRSYLLEHEASLGTRDLVFYGGTNHSMGHSFIDRPVQDILFRRRSLRSRFMEWVAPMSLAGKNPFGRTNFLGEAIASGELRWQPLLMNRRKTVRPRAHRRVMF
ncbi:MAG: GNAT family N-acetyltransferase [Acidobacteriaceae bacterium]|nr:GNAT family N-acetyltransferase [Acidobacteriaceae bacterium]